MLRVLAGCLVLIGMPCAVAATPRPAPQLMATLLDGAHFDSAAQRGKVILVNFWASWCAPCREEMPAIESFYRRHRDHGLEVIAISMDEDKDAATVRRLAQAHTFPIALASQANYKGFGRIWRLPMTFVIDREGRLREEITARTAQVDLDFLEARVTPLLESR